MNKTIYFTGFMGSGKSTIAQELGHVLSIPVIDTDLYITKMDGISIPEIFLQKGEDYFRELETKALREIGAGNIISTGGGIITREENRRWMLENGLVIFLDCDVEELWKRISGDSSRPLAKSKEEVRRLYLNRRPMYEQCHIRIDTTERTVEQTLSIVLQELEKK